MYDWIQFCTSTFLWWSLGGCATIFSGTNICSYPKFIFFLLRNHHEPLGPAPDILRNAQSSGVGGAFTVACSWKLEQTLGLSKKIKVIMKRTKIQKPNKTLAPFFPPKKSVIVSIFTENVKPSRKNKRYNKDDWLHARHLRLQLLLHKHTGRQSLLLLTVVLVRCDWHDYCSLRFTSPRMKPLCPQYCTVLSPAQMFHPAIKHKAEKMQW